MADNPMNNDPYASLIAQMQNAQMTQEQVLRSIEASLRELVRDNERARDPRFSSQSHYNDRTNAGSDRFGRNTRSRWGQRYDDEVDFRWNASNMRRRGQTFERIVDDFTEEFERQIWQSIAGDPISKMLAPSIAAFANNLGTSVEDLGKTIGQKLGQNVADKFKQTAFGEGLSKELEDIKEDFTNRVTDGLVNMADALNSGQGVGGVLRAFRDGAGLPQSLADLRNVTRNVGSDLLKLGQNGGRLIQAFQGAFTHGGGLLGGLEAVSTAVSGLGLTALGAGPHIVTLGLAAGAAGVAVLAVDVIVKAAQRRIEQFKEALKPASEAAKNFADALKKSANKDQDAAKQRLDNYMNRIKKDNETYIRAPFNILEKAANDVYAAWDNVIRLVGQTQGYDKAGLQDLWSSYASRLKQEGLDSVVSSADIMTSLGNVLKSGMSGAIAEEFAYIATVLNNAIPTEDFFNYASTYASIAANAIKNGKSQTEAIKDANEQLEQFASNLLYSNRQIAGGFTTGLANASQLFEAASHISVAAHTNNTAEISGVLTSVSAIVGAIAPDLTNSIVTKITEAATGGNETSLVALRSLAGTGASNTAFLQALAKDPQSVFSAMFEKLAVMQNMYGDNYMEVASSLAQTFGMTIDELSRIDFGYLAQAVKAMDINNASLEENLAQLGSGATTYTAEQLRMQQVNKYMMDEGLAYVLDNEVARTIQEHMWEEQIANQLMENEYSVNLQGEGLAFLQGLQFSVDNIFTLLNPFGWLKKVESLVATASETLALNSDIVAMLNKTKVGTGSAATLYNLTTGRKDLHLTQSYLELLGGHSAYSLVQSTHSILGRLLGNKYLSNNGNSRMIGGDLAKGLLSSSVLASRTPAADKASSQYSWATIGKSVTQSLLTTGNKALYNSGSAYEDINLTPQQKISSKAAQTMQNYLDTMQTFVDEGKSYEEWKESASDYGIEDLDAALQDYSLSEVEAKGKFQEMEAVKAAMYEHERDMKEEKFWDDMIKWCEEDFPAYQEQVYAYYDDIIIREDNLITNTDLIIGELQDANKQLKEFYHQWIDYFVNHTAYHRDTLNAHDVEAIRTAEKDETGDAVFALAQALVDNMVNLQDPEVQQNALLSQILLVVEAIFQIQNNTTTVSLPTALSSLGLGVTSAENQY